MVLPNRFGGEFEDLREEVKEIECPKCQSKNLRKHGVGKEIKKQQYRCNDCNRVFVLDPIHISAKYILPPNITPQEMFLFDIWDVRVLGLKPGADREITLAFTEITPDWLKYAVKRWIQYRSANMTAGTLQNNLTELRIFSKFVNGRYLGLNSQDINREIIENYLVYLKEQQYGTSHRKGCIITLKQLLECCSRFDYIKVPKEGLIFKEDIPKRVSKIPRFIPPNVIKQLEDSLHMLPQPVIFMVKVLRETGMRISELCYLKFNCIRQDSTGGYWIDYFQIKMKKEITINISRELAVDIQEQQQYINRELRNNFSYLFCETEGFTCFHEYLKPKEKRFRRRHDRPINHFVCLPQTMHTNTLRSYLHRLAEERKIVDDSGKIFPLGHCHRFRHTHGTELINSGVPQHIVQKRLGHASPTMTSVYAHVHDETMKQSMEKFWDGRVVNIKGEVVIPENPDLDTAEMQWIKKNMKIQTLPDGFCGLPITKTCPVQGSPCLTCQYLRTTKDNLETHKKRLEETEKLIENARTQGWQRQIENNLPIADNLRNIIRGLEQKDVIYGNETYPESGGK